MMKFKKKIQLITAVITLVASGVCFANKPGWWGYDLPSVGIAFKYFSFSSSENKLIFNGINLDEDFKKAFDCHTGIELFVVTKFAKCFSTEVSYTYFGNKEVPVLEEGIKKGFVENKLSSVNLNINGYYPLCNNVKLIGTVGFGMYLSSILADIQVQNNRQARNVSGTVTKNHFVPRLGIGVENSLCACGLSNVIVRAQVLWEFTSVIKHTIGGKEFKPYGNNTLVGALGLAYQF